MTGHRNIPVYTVMTALHVSVTVRRIFSGRPSARPVRQQSRHFGGSPFPSPAVWRCTGSYSWRPRLYHNHCREPIPVH